MQSWGGLRVRLSTRIVLEGLGRGWLVGPSLGGIHTYVPHRFRQDFGGFFRHKDVAGKPVVSRVLSDKPKVPVGGQRSVWAGWGLRPLQAHL